MVEIGSEVFVNYSGLAGTGIVKDVQNGTRCIAVEFKDSTDLKKHGKKITVNEPLRHRFHNCGGLCEKGWLVPEGNYELLNKLPHLVMTYAKINKFEMPLNELLQ